MNKIEKCIKIVTLNDKDINTLKKPYMVYSIPDEDEIEKIKNEMSKNSKLTGYKILTMGEDGILSDKCNTKKAVVLTTIENARANEQFKKDYFLLNYDDIVETEYYLFPANFKHFNFKKLNAENQNKGDEYAKYTGIMWDNGPVNNIDIRVNLGDTVYVYYSEMPDGVNRILYKCTVIDDGMHYFQINDKNRTENEEDFSQYEGLKREIRLRFEYGINTEDRTMFSTKQLKDSYGITSFRGKQALKEEIHQDLINALNEIDASIKEDKNSSLKKRLSELTVLTNNECACQHCFEDIPSNHHKTFKKDNDIWHYEVHHLIEQNNIKKFQKPEKDSEENDIEENKDFNKELNSIIYNADNEYYLCPNCHRRIHIGKIEDRIKMVEYLYNNNKKNVDALLSRLAKLVPEIKGKEFEWLKSQYQIH